MCKKKFGAGNSPCSSCDRDGEPVLLPENLETVEVHRLCWTVRDGMSGCLNYEFLGKIMEKYGFSDEEWILNLAKIQHVEHTINNLIHTKKEG